MTGSRKFIKLLSSGLNLMTSNCQGEAQVFLSDLRCCAVSLMLWKAWRHHCHHVQPNPYQQVHLKKSMSSRKNNLVWWFQPIWKICPSKWESSPNRDENKKWLKPPPSNESNPNQQPMHSNIAKRTFQLKLKVKDLTTSTQTACVIPSQQHSRNIFLRCRLNKCFWRLNE